MTDKPDNKTIRKFNLRKKTYTTVIAEHTGRTTCLAEERRPPVNKTWRDYVFGGLTPPPMLPIQYSDYIPHATPVANPHNTVLFTFSGRQPELEDLVRVTVANIAKEYSDDTDHTNTSK